MFVFGGQKSEFSYSDTVSILDTGRMSWGSGVYAAGSGQPGPREDCSVAYDPKTCNIVFFGGWKQGWLDDLWCLNVAGIVGPSYAVQSLSPATGPITGNTPVSIHGIGFIESKSVSSFAASGFGVVASASAAAVMMPPRSVPVSKVVISDLVGFFCEHARRC